MWVPAVTALLSCCGWTSRISAGHFRVDKTIDLGHLLSLGHCLHWPPGSWCLMAAISAAAWTPPLWGWGWVEDNVQQSGSLRNRSAQKRRWCWPVIFCVARLPSLAEVSRPQCGHGPPPWLGYWGALPLSGTWGLELLCPCSGADLVLKATRHGDWISTGRSQQGCLFTCWGEKQHRGGMWLLRVLVTLVGKFLVVQNSVETSGILLPANKHGNNTIMGMRRVKSWNYKYAPRLCT